MRKYLCSALVVGMALILAGSFPLSGQTKLDPYLEIELKRVEETYRLMDKFAQKIWPGWNNYPEIEFQVQYPNLVFLLIGPREKVPNGYELVPGRTLRGKKIYLNRKEELPIKIKPPLTGGGGGGLTIRIHLRESGITSEDVAKAIEKNLKDKDPSFQPMASSDGEILLYVHEFFHGYQRRAIKSEREGEKARQKIKDAIKKGVKPEIPKEEKKKTQVQPERDFDVNPEYSTYSNIEGLALLNAFNEKDKKKALESFKDYSVAREIKHGKHMTPGAALSEVMTTLMEGTASYSDSKMAMLIRDKKYKPNMGPKDDPFFFNFKYAGGYVHEKTIRSIEGIMGETLDTLGKCYTYGLFQCLLLDRFFPGWKKGFFENDRNLDEVTAEKLRLSDAEKAAVAGRLKSKYKYDDLYAKHAAVIANRDEIRNIVTSRKGLTYIIDYQKTREFLLPVGRKGGRDVRVGVAGYFVNGIEEYKMGDVILTTWNTPIHKPFLYTLEWTDTEAKSDVKGYTFYYEKQEGDVYKNVIFTTPGFTLKAPEVQIKENKDKNQFRIIILRKVAK
jgi:hypothetical protein